jgi:hypothetical protein
LVLELVDSAVVRSRWWGQGNPRKVREGMSWGTFDLVILLGATCGALMVSGGLLLLMRGAISLKREPGGEGGHPGLSVEFQGLKLNTDYPALALFLIGLLFVGGAAWLVQPPEIVPLDVTGQIETNDPTGVEVVIRSLRWDIDVDDGGVIDSTVHPHLRKLQLEINAPSHKPEPIRKTINPRLSAGNGSSLVVDLGVISLGPPLRERSAPTVIETPRARLPARHEAGGF